MKAVVVREFGAPEVMRIEEFAHAAPAAGQVLVAVKAVGVNPVETYIRSGSYAKKPELPYTPGTDCAGVVEAVGPGVSSVKPGDRVWTAGSVSGTYAEKALCREADVCILPAKVSFPQGAALGVPYSTAFHALFQAGKAAKGSTVLVRGATGGVGVAALQLARAAGCAVAGTAGTPAGRDLVEAQGASVLGHDAAGFTGADVIIEMLANANLGRDPELLAPGGRIIVVGSRGPVEINPRDLMSRRASVHGIMLWLATPEERAEANAAINAGLESGKLNPVVAREFPLDQAPAAHEAVMAPGHAGKVVLVP